MTDAVIGFAQPIQPASPALSWGLSQQTPNLTVGGPGSALRLSGNAGKGSFAKRMASRLRKSGAAVLFLYALFAAMPIKSALAQTLPPFSPVIEANGVLYLAGHLGRDPETRVLPDGIGAQTRQTLENIGATLATVHATHADIVRCQVFLADIADFSAMNEVYRTFFPANPPARTTVAVSGLALGAKIEIECTAVRGHGVKTEASK